MRSYTIVTVRLLRNLLLLLPAVFAFLLIRTFARDRAPRFLRWLLETAGAGFVKLGQLLALRADLLPLCYCQELAHLLDQVRPIPVSRIIATIEADLNVSVDARDIAGEIAVSSVYSLGGQNAALVFKRA